MTLPLLIESLLTPDAYPDRPSTIDLIQTHISYILITPVFVYKIKKPVNFGFLDFTTLEKRRFFCEQEVKLNRRLSPDIYLGVARIVKKDEGLFIYGDGRTVEYAVKMKRLPGERMMDRLLNKGGVTEEMVRRLARRMASFYIIAAGLLSLNYKDYDFNIIGGTKYDRWLTGFGWVGDIYSAGFRGEILISKGRKTSVPLYNYSFGSNKVVYSFVISGDYTFPSSFYIHTEILHNSVGVKDSTSLFQQSASELGFLSAARWALYQEFAYDIHPLVRGTVFGLFNPDDKSFVIVPSVSYSVITNLDFLLLGMFFNGDSLSQSLS